MTPPAYVKPYLRRQKNDAARAVVEGHLVAVAETRRPAKARRTPVSHGTPKPPGNE
jgi:hypothetical protein